MANDFEIGALLLEQIADRPAQRYESAIRARGRRAPRPGPVGRRTDRPGAGAGAVGVLEADPVRELITTDGPHEIWVDRKLGEFSAWYEFFPRSQGAEVAPNGKPVRHGTLRDAIDALPRVARMGFDIIYLPPIHPIGRLNRKGPNNTVHSEPDDVGSPWAIGAAEGGHDAIHPELGTIDDFDAFVAAANGPRPRGRDGPGAAVRAGPPLGRRAPGVVHHPPRRHHRLRGEPAEEVPGHLSAQLRQRPGGPLRRGAAGREVLDQPRRHGVPGRQPAHQAGRLLGVADRRGAQGHARRRCSSPRRSPGRR